MYGDDQVDEDPVLKAIRRRQGAPAPIPEAGTGGPIYAPVEPSPVAPATLAKPVVEDQPAAGRALGGMTNQPDRSITDPTIPPEYSPVAPPADLSKPVGGDQPAADRAIGGYGQQSAAPVGHDGVWNGMTREQWRDDWMRQGPMPAAQMDQWMAAHGATKAGGSGRFTTPFGETGDLGINYNTGTVTPGWFSGGGGGGGGSAGGGAGGAAGASGGSSFQDETRRLLMEQIAAMSRPVTADDPAIKGELAAQKMAIERNRQARRGSDAERAAFQGLLNGGQSSGSFDTDVASGFEDAGHQMSDVQAQLFSRELTARRDKLSQLLATAVQTGDNEMARGLQLQIAEMDAELRRQSMSQQQSFHDDDYGLSADQLRYQRDRDTARIKLGYPI